MEAQIGGSTHKGGREGGSGERKKVWCLAILYKVNETRRHRGQSHRANR